MELFRFLFCFHTSLDSILGHFTHVHDALSKFVEKTEKEVANKSSKVDYLQNAINWHRGDIATARTVQDNIKKFIGR